MTTAAAEIARLTCCCGDLMSDHTGYEGHHAKSMYDHALELAEEERDRLRATNADLEAPQSLHDYP